MILFAQVEEKSQFQRSVLNVNALSLKGKDIEPSAIRIEFMLVVASFQDNKFKDAKVVIIPDLSYFCPMINAKQFKIHSNSLDPKQGDVLIAEPLTNDFHFGRSVVLIVDHSESEGSFGIIINKKMDLNVCDIVDEFPDFEAPVYLGGPVGETQLFFIHTLGEMIPDACEITEGLWWGGDSTTLQRLVSTGIANESNTRFFLGYSGWDAGQLVTELVRNSWLISKIDAAQVFETPCDTMWQSLVDKMGDDYALWKYFPKDFESN